MKQQIHRSIGKFFGSFLSALLPKWPLRTLKPRVSWASFESGKIVEDRRNPSKFRSVKQNHRLKNIHFHVNLNLFPNIHWSKLKTLVPVILWRRLILESWRFKLRHWSKASHKKNKQSSLLRLSCFLLKILIANKQGCQNFPLKEQFQVKKINVEKHGWVWCRRSPWTPQKLLQSFVANPRW